MIWKGKFCIRKEKLKQKCGEDGEGKRESGNEEKETKVRRGRVGSKQVGGWRVKKQQQKM